MLREAGAIALLLGGLPPLSASAKAAGCLLLVLGGTGRNRHEGKRRFLCLLAIGRASFPALGAGKRIPHLGRARFCLQRTLATLVTSILCLRGNFTSSQGLREFCQTHSLLLCELAQWGLWLQLQQSSAPLFSPWLQKGVHFVV